MVEFRAREKRMHNLFPELSCFSNYTCYRYLDLHSNYKTNYHIIPGKIMISDFILLKRHLIIVLLLGPNDLPYNSSNYKASV